MLSRKILGRVSLAIMVIFCLMACSGENNNAVADQGGSKSGRSGTVTMEGETYTVDKFLQCSVFKADTVSISGSAGDNEIVLDVFRLGTAQLAITVDGTEWRGNAIAPNISVDDATISGTANLGSPGAGKMVKAAFDFRCR